MDKLPKRCGISLTPRHYKEILDTQPRIAWLEAEPSYYLGLGGSPRYYLDQIREQYPVTFNSQMLSIGSAESVDAAALNNLRQLCEVFQPVTVVEKLCWSRWQGTYLRTPLPIPYNFEALDQVSLNIKAVQNSLGRRILVENPMQFMPLEPQDFSEGEFLEELVRATGCGVALNVSHLYQSNTNFHTDPFKAIADYPLAAIKQIQLTGQVPLPLDKDHLVIMDAANGDIGKPVWRLYQALLRELPGATPSLIQWTGGPPKLSQAVDLAEYADEQLFEVHPLRPRELQR